MIPGATLPQPAARPIQNAWRTFHWRKTLLAGFLLTSIPLNAHAQREFEVTPFFGTRLGGTIDLSLQGNPNVDFLKIKNSGSYGVLFDMSLGRSVQGEFMWNRQPTSLTSHNPNDGTYTFLSSMNFDMYQFGILYEPDRLEKRLRPFVDLEFGFSHYGLASADTQRLLNFSYRFAMNMGGGVKYFLTRNVGLRAEARWSPSNTTGKPVEYCVGPILASCYPTTDPNSALQGQFNVGVILRFK